MVALFYPVSAQEKSVTDKIIAIGKTDNRTMQHLDVLTNRIGGRLLGSDAYENATYWAAGLFKKWGLEVIVQEAGELPVGFNRGPWFGRMLSEDGMVLHFATPSYTSGTKGAQRGHVVAEPKTRAEFERMKGKLKGAWVLITGDNDGWPIDYSAYADTLRSQIIQENFKASQYNDSIGRINRENANKPDNRNKLDSKNKSDNKNSAEIAKKELRDSPALFYKEMRAAGILGIIQSTSVPIRALYDRKNIEYMTWDELPSCPDIKLDESQYKIMAQKVKERQYFQLEFDIRNTSNQVLLNITMLLVLSAEPNSPMSMLCPEVT